MKLKTYFSPKTVRVIAVSLFAVALVYAAMTALDVMHPPATEQTPPAEQTGQAPLKQAPAKPTEKQLAKAREKAIEALEECRDKNSAWFACKSDTECKGVIGPCLGRDAVNRDFRNEVEKCYREIAAAMKCIARPDTKGFPACVEGQCVLRARNASKPKP